MARDYSKTRVYQIVSEKTDKIYVGSTIQSLAERLRGHKADMKAGTYCSSQEILKYGDAQIVLLEAFKECQSEEQKRAYEYQWMQKKKSEGIELVNRNMPTRTQKERYNENHNDVVEKKKQYYNEHRDMRVAQMKQYAADNHDELLANQRQYGAEHRSERKVRISAPLTCGCGASITLGSKARHGRSQKHIKLAESDQIV